MERVRSIPPPERLRYEYRGWSGVTGVEDQPMPPILIVEGIRLLHERTRDWFDLVVRIDLDREAAGARAKARNHLQGDDQIELDLEDIAVRSRNPAQPPADPDRAVALNIGHGAMRGNRSLAGP